MDVRAARRPPKNSLFGPPSRAAAGASFTCRCYTMLAYAPRPRPAPRAPGPRRAHHPPRTPRSKQSSKGKAKPATCTGLLSGKTFFVDMKIDGGDVDASESFRQKLRNLGATLSTKFTSDVSHVLFKEGSVKAPPPCSAPSRARRRSRPTPPAAALAAQPRAAAPTAPPRSPPPTSRAPPGPAAALYQPARATLRPRLIRLLIPRVRVIRRTTRRGGATSPS